MYNIPLNLLPHTILYQKKTSGEDGSVYDDAITIKNVRFRKKNMKVTIENGLEIVANGKIKIDRLNSKAFDDADDAITLPLDDLVIGSIIIFDSITYHIVDIDDPIAKAELPPFRNVIVK